MNKLSLPVFHLKKISGYNWASFPVLREVARFKFGDQSQRKKVVDSVANFLKRTDHNFTDVTLVVPCSKSPLPRPTTKAGKEIASFLGMNFLEGDFISKLGKEGVLHYAGLTDRKAREQQKKNQIKIEVGKITTPFVMLFDDTYASGATLREYWRAVREASAQVEEGWGITYARYATQDFLIEDINNHLILWDLPELVSLFNQVGEITNTAFRVLMNLSPYLFARLVSNLSPEFLKVMNDIWESFLHNGVEGKKKELAYEKLDILQGKIKFPESISITSSHNLSFSYPYVLRFGSRKEFAAFAKEAPFFPFRDSDFVIVEGKNGFRPFRFMSNSGRWVAELNVYSSLAELASKTIMGEIKEK